MTKGNLEIPQSSTFKAEIMPAKESVRKHPIKKKSTPINPKHPFDTIMDFFGFLHMPTDKADLLLLNRAARQIDCEALSGREKSQLLHLCQQILVFTKAIDILLKAYEDGEFLNRE